MNRLDNLIIKASEQIENDRPQLYWAVIQYNKEMQNYIATGYIFGDGANESWSHPYDTEGLAIESLHNLAKVFPSEIDMPIIFIDYDSGMGG